MARPEGPRDEAAPEEGLGDGGRPGRCLEVDEEEVRHRRRHPPAEGRQACREAWSLRLDPGEVLGEARRVAQDGGADGHRRDAHRARRPVRLEAGDGRPRGDGEPDPGSGDGVGLRERPDRHHVRPAPVADDGRPPDELGVGLVDDDRRRRSAGRCGVGRYGRRAGRRGSPRARLGPSGCSDRRARRGRPGRPPSEGPPGRGATRRSPAAGGRPRPWPAAARSRPGTWRTSGSGRRPSRPVGGRPSRRGRGPRRPLPRRGSRRVRPGRRRRRPRRGGGSRSAGTRSGARRSGPRRGLWPRRPAGSGSCSGRSGRWSSDRARSGRRPAPSSPPRRNRRGRRARRR
ncbi:MAG: hypothetical protein KatS3mg065_0440 [Chloroflexota bacterium]|nr:MAG: hypothetical protein KatS3mg065_0440 [Chloroflexota bacterium]